MAPSAVEAILDAEPPQVYTLKELSAHSTREDLWIAVDGGVYDFSGMKATLLHPGGVPPLLEVRARAANATSWLD